MGNSTSHRNITVVNDGLVPVIESQKGEPVKATPAPGKAAESKKTPNDRVFLNRDIPPNKEILATQEEQLRAAIAPFKKLTERPTDPPATPTEQKVLLECFKKNPKNSLVCVREIQNFVNYVNHTTTTTSKPQP